MIAEIIDVALKLACDLLTLDPRAWLLVLVSGSLYVLVVGLVVLLVPERVPPAPSRGAHPH